MYQIRIILMTSFLTGVVSQQRITVAILTGRGQKDFGAIHWIQMCHGNHVTFQNVVNCIMLLK